MGFLTRWPPGSGRLLRRSSPLAPSTCRAAGAAGGDPSARFRPGPGPRRARCGRAAAAAIPLAARDLGAAPQGRTIAWTVPALNLRLAIGHWRWQRPFLPPVTDDIALDLIETRTFGSRVIYERYGRVRDESE